MLNLRLALRLARRELRGGFAGFRIFFLCLMLGSAAIAGVQSLSDAFLAGLQVTQAPGGHQVHQQHQLAVLGWEEESLGAALGSGETPSLECRERRVERLQRRDVRRPGPLDRECAHGIVELAAPRLHLRQLRQLPSRPCLSR